MFTSLSTATGPILAATVNWGEQITFILVGFGVVLGILASLALITSLIGKYFKAQAPAAKEKTKPAKKAASAAAAAKAASPAPAAKAAPATPAQPAEGPPEDEPVVIAMVAAAVHTILGQHVRIVSIRPAQAGWAQEGRRQHFSSHRLR